jgi:hypothetical protein
MSANVHARLALREPDQQAVRSMINFFSRLSEAVDKTWLESVIGKTSNSYASDSVARRHLANLLARSANIPRVTSLDIPEGFEWIALSRGSLQVLARRTGVQVLRPWIAKMISRLEIERVEAAIGHEARKAAIDCPIELLIDGDICEVARRTSSPEVMLNFVTDIGWDCMKAATRFAVDRDSAVMWRLILSAPIEHSKEAMNWQASYDHVKALSLLSEWAEEICST